MTLLILVGLLWAPTSTQASNGGAIFAGWSFSPTTYGGDTNGIHLWRVSGEIQLSPSWSLQGNVMHGYFTDYPSLGRIYITPIAIGAKAYAAKGRIRPYGNLLLGGTELGYGGGSSGVAVPTLEAGGGLQLEPMNRLALDVDATYVRTGSSEIPTFDVPPLKVNGLHQVFLQLSLCFLLGK
jgi:hypothetical protein